VTRANHAGGEREPAAMLRTRGGAADGWQTSPAQARAARDRAASSYGSPLRVTLLMHARSLLVHILDAPETRKIFLFFLINFVFMLVEVAYGMWSNSLGLISDAAHMLFDCSALLLGLAASYIARWRADEAFSFGYGRAEVLAGFTNALFLLFIAIYILFEALERLLSPPHVDPVSVDILPLCIAHACTARQQLTRWCGAVRRGAAPRVCCAQDALFTVSVIGLLVNCIGLAFFWEQHAAVCADEHCVASHDHGGSENMRALFLHVSLLPFASEGIH
jgi:Co/Zn/Cd efflux system component